MIDREFAKKQIKRLAGLDFFPGEPLAVGELVTALQLAATEPRAKAIIDGFMADRMVCPKPCEIRDQAQVETVHAKVFQGYEPSPIACAKCKDWGHVAFGSVQVRCTCEAGENLDQKYLSHLNSYRPKVSKLVGFKRITAEDIEVARRKA